MKISQQDKTDILEKVINTLTESLQDKYLDPKALLLECYTTWFAREVTPYQSNALYALIPEVGNCELKLEAAGVDNYIKIAALETQSNPLRFSLRTVETLYKESLTGTQQKLINTGTSTYYGRVNIKLDTFPELYKKLLDHNTALQEAAEHIKAEAEKLNSALDTVNTYKQLQDRLPVIFNAMPSATKEKYEAYRQRIKDARRKKTEIPEDLGDFSSLGTTLAVASLKSDSE